MKVANQSPGFRWSSLPNKGVAQVSEVYALSQKRVLRREDHTLKSWKRIAIGLISLLGLIGVAACSGQPLGAAVGSPGAGAAIGGALGGVGGFAVGNSMQNRETQQAQTQAQIAQQQRQLERQRLEIERLRSQQG